MNTVDGSSKQYELNAARERDLGKGNQNKKTKTTQRGSRPRPKNRVHWELQHPQDNETSSGKKAKRGELAGLANW